MSTSAQLRWAEIKEAERRDPQRAKSTRIGQFAAGAVIVFDGLQVGGFPINEFAAIFLIVIGMTQLVRPGLKFPWLMSGSMLAMALWLAMSNVLNDDPIDIRRVGHLLIWTTLAYVFASGRLHLPSVFKGMLFGVVTGAVIYLAGIHVTYPGRLSGYLGDPNGAGMIIATYGLIAIGVLTFPHRARQLVLAMVVGGVVALTLSRTTLAGLSMAFIWVLAAPRLRPILSIAMVAGLMQYLRSLPPDAAQSGVFADRVGSDNLRQRLLDLEQVSVERHLWYGNGAGTAKVHLNNSSEFFFHNSYLGMRAEGGWIAIIIMTMAIVAVAWPVLKLRVSQRNPWFEAAVVAPLICSINLGEVLLATPMAVALGVLWHHYATAALDRSERGGKTIRPHPALRGADPRAFT